MEVKNGVFRYSELIDDEDGDEGDTQHEEKDDGKGLFQVRSDDGHLQVALTFQGKV